LSYDVVALVAGQPDERAVIDALRGVDQELRLHQHGHTAVLQIRDDDRRLVATLEPGRPIERWDDVGACSRAVIEDTPWLRSYRTGGSQ
jgi:hypothetical protein